MNKKMIASPILMAFAVLACSFGSVIAPTPTNVPPVVPTDVPPVVPTDVPPVVPTDVPPVVPTMVQPTQTSEVQSSLTNLPFIDDFSNVNSGWEIGSYDTGSVGYGSGYYFVKATSNGVNMYGAAFQNDQGTAIYDVQDVVIEVNAAQVSGPSDNNTGYGVICRLQTSDDGYYFRIGGDGTFSVDVAAGGNFTSLLTGDRWQAADSVIQGNAANYLAVTCNGDHLIFEVNGVTLFDGYDSTYTVGGMGLLGIVYEDNATAEFHFTNFLAVQP